jgi:hypothetical protein
MVGQTLSAYGDEGSSIRTPNFFYIGTSKAGSTWIYGLLARHPRVYMAPGKGLYFFDEHYERGFEWYLSHFHASADKCVVGEVAHGYLYSGLACQRIAQFNPASKLMVSLREPVDRAFSAYLHAVKNNQFEGSFEAALEQIPSLIDRGRYATYLLPYIQAFGRDRIHIAIYDDLVRNPEEFARQLFAFLEIESLDVSGKAAQKMMPAGTPRVKVLTKLSKRASALLRRWGWRELRGRLKTSRLVRNLLYRQFTPEDKPKIDPDTERRLRDYFCEEVSRLDGLTGRPLSRLWRY